MIGRKEPLALALARGTGASALSPQQREVALLLAEGNSNQEIARALDLTLNTANYHVKQVFARLQVHHRDEVADVLLRLAQNGAWRIGGRWPARPDAARRPLIAGRRLPESCPSPALARAHSSKVPRASAIPPPNGWEWRVAFPRPLSMVDRADPSLGQPSNQHKGDCNEAERAMLSGAKTVVVRRFPNAPVKVEIGNGAIAPKVALKRAKQPVKVEIGNGAIAPKVAMKRGRETSRG